MHTHSCGCSGHCSDHCGCNHDHSGKALLIRMGIGAFLFLGALMARPLGCPNPIVFSLFLAAYLTLGYDILLAALRGIVCGRVFDENFLMGLSSLVALAIGEAPEAVAVMLFFQLGEYFQSLAVDRSRRSISALMDIRPDTATVCRNGLFLTVTPDAVAVGEQIRILPGEKIPLDGIVTEGTSTLDTRALTGEALPKTVCPGEPILSGCVNGSGLLTVQVTKPFGESTVSKILALTESAAKRKAPAEKFITSFAKYYTPAVVILAALMALLPPLFWGNWSQWLHRSCVFLVISCPCALVISVPLAFFGGIGAAARRGILVKGGNYLEELTKVTAVAFDKTGTLTQGVFAVQKIFPAPEFTQQQVLQLAAQAESLSSHPIARSVLTACKEAPYAKPLQYQEFPGRGICMHTEKGTILAGNQALMEQFSIPFTPCTAVGTRVYVAKNDQFAGCILISDQPKPGAAQAISALKKAGIQKTVMLTGDEETLARHIAQELGLDAFHAALLPQDKVTHLEQLMTQEKTAYVGDGINDAPVLALADVGIAMGALGSDAAIEAADIVLMTDQPEKLGEAIAIAKATRRIVFQNIVFALGIKLLFLILGALGLLGMWPAVFADVGVALLAVANSLRILKK